MKNEIKWEVVEELSDDDNITHNYRNTFDVERSALCSDSGISFIKSFKRFNNAKRFAEDLINNYE